MKSYQDTQIFNEDSPWQQVLINEQSSDIIIEYLSLTFQKWLGIINLTFLQSSFL